MLTFKQRTRALVSVGVVVAASTALLGASPAAADDPPPGLIPEGDWSEVEIDWMVAKIQETEQVLPEVYPTSYDDGGSALEEMGFTNFGATAPGGYDHWTNIPRVGDSHFLNPEFAESLVYQHTGDGVWELKAAMFMYPTEPNDVPSLISWLPGWHNHPELCAWPDGTFAGITDPNDPSCPEGSSQLLIPTMMHIWIEDPGCGHRFGGVGVGGLHCDVHGGDH